MVGCTVSFGVGFTLFPQNCKNVVCGNELCGNRNLNQTAAGREISLTRPPIISERVPSDYVPKEGEEVYEFFVRQHSTGVWRVTRKEVNPHASGT